MDYSKLKGASEKVSPPKTQTFAKHAPVLPKKSKLTYSK